MKPLISVIVTAHNRKQFLSYALKSLEKQTLDKNKFEVVVVKNFEDPISDNIIKRNKWKNIITDIVPLGGKIALGLKESKGNIITFLEDDDMYREDRLEKIYKAFSSIPDLVYFHNEQIVIDEEGKAISKSPYPALKVPIEIILDSKLLLKVDDKLGMCKWQLLPFTSSFFGPYLDFNNSSI
ncbi:MAG: glycosyltransferase family 2 protein, partial [Nanopusillaceae archaeon]